MVKKNRKYIITKVGRGFIGVISADDTFKLIKKNIKKYPWFLTDAHTLKKNKIIKYFNLC